MKLIIYINKACPYCQALVGLFRNYGISLDADPRVDLRDQSHESYPFHVSLFGYKKVPFMLVGNRIVGGYDDNARSIIDGPPSVWLDKQIDLTTPPSIQ